jgi:hypothetical protein
MRLASGLSVDGFPEGTVLKAKRVKGGNVELRYHFPNYERDIKTNDPAMVLSDTVARLIARCAALTFGKYTSEIFAEAFEGYAYPDAKEPALGSPKAAKRVGTYTELVTGKVSKASAESDEGEAKEAKVVAPAKLNLLEFLLEDGVFALPVLTGNVKPVSGDGIEHTIIGLAKLKLHHANKVDGSLVEVKPNVVVGQTWAAQHKNGEYVELSKFFRSITFALIPVPRIYQDLVALAEGLAEECAELMPSEEQEPDVYAFLTQPKEYLNNYLTPKSTDINTRARFEKGSATEAKKLVRMLDNSTVKKLVAIPVVSRSDTGERQVYLFVLGNQAVSVATRLARELGITRVRRVGGLTHPAPTYSNVGRWASVIGRVFGGTEVLGDTLDTFSRDLAEVAHGKLKTSHEKQR